MRRIDRRLVLLSIVLACDVVSVFGRPQEQRTATGRSNDDLLNRYTAFTVATPKSADTVESYLNTSKRPFAANAPNRKEDARYAEPDPSLGPFFQFLLNSTKRKKRNLKHDSRLVEDFINYSMNDLRNPIHADSVVFVHTAPGPSSSYKYEPDAQYLPVPLYTKVPSPEPTSGGSAYQSPSPDPYDRWQETPLIFPGSNLKPSTTRPPTVSSSSSSSSSNYYTPDYDDGRPVLSVPDRPPTFVTPVQFQAPTFITPVEYPGGPTFVPPVSVDQTPVWDGNPPPTIVILEDIDTENDSPESDSPESDPPQSDPTVEQDPGGAGGSGGSSSAAGGAAAAAAVAAGIGAAATGAGIAGVSVGSAALAVGVSGGGGGGGGLGGGAGGGGGDLATLTPADQVQCRSGGNPSNVCSQLITTTSSSPADSGTWLLDGLISLFASLNLIGPLALTFWSIIFPPMSIILTSGLGVVAFLFPWLLPRLWFGRQLRPPVNVNRFDRRVDDPNNFHQPYYY